MPTPDSSHDFKSSDAMLDITNDRAARLAEVRADLAALVADVKRVAEARASQVKDAAIDGAEAGVDFARDTIRSHPIPAIAIAAVVGAVIAVALIPATRQPRSVRLADWAPELSRAHLGELAQNLQRSASSTGSLSLTSRSR